MAARGRISGLHFRALDGLDNGTQITRETTLNDLISWGYVTIDGIQKITGNGREALRTWREMKTEN